MRFDKFTIKSREAVQDALQAAGSLGHQEIGPDILSAVPLSISCSILLGFSRCLSLLRKQESSSSRRQRRCL